MKIVTLLPSATEIVCALGLGEHLVGVSHSCNYPSFVNELLRMTGTHVPFTADSQTIDSYVREHLSGHTALYDLDMEKLQQANPDVIISQALCDVCAVATGDVTAAIGSLPGDPLLIDLTPTTLEDVFDDITRVGAALEADVAAGKLVRSLKIRRDRVAARSAEIPQEQHPRVAFLEWLMPPFNGGHWNPELVKLAGGIDLLGDNGGASSTLQWSNVVDSAPDVLFIACCGLRVDRALADVEAVSQNKHWQRLPATAKNRVYVADGNAYFSCPGPRLIDGLEILAHALHPTIHAQADAGIHHQFTP